MGRKSALAHAGAMVGRQRRTCPGSAGRLARHMHAQPAQPYIDIPIHINLAPAARRRRASLSPPGLRRLSPPCIAFGPCPQLSNATARRAPPSHAAAAAVGLQERHDDGAVVQLAAARDQLLPQRQHARLRGLSGAAARQAQAQWTSILMTTFTALANPSVCALSGAYPNQC